MPLIAPRRPTIDPESCQWVTAQTGISASRVSRPVSFLMYLSTQLAQIASSIKASR